MSINAFGVEFEREILALSAKDTAFRRQVKRVLGNHEFSTKEHSWFWSLLDGLPKSDRCTGAIVTVAIRRDFDEDKRRPYLSTSLDILKLSPKAPRRALEELESYRDYHRITDVMDVALRLLDKGKVKEAKAKLREIGRSRSSIDYEYTDWIEDFEDRQIQREDARDHPEKQLKIPTHFLPTFDRATHGGIEAEVALVVATTGRGKSIFASNVSFWSAFEGHPTVYVSTEMKHPLVSTRLDARWLGISYDRLKYFDLEDSDLEAIATRFERSRERLARKLRVVSISVRKAKIETIEQIIEDFEDENGEAVQLLVCDSGDHLTPSEKTNDRRAKEGLAYWELKSIADERNLGIWSPSHAPKDVVNKIATAENVGETYDKARIADIVLTLNQTKAQAREGILRGYLAKYRQGKGRYIIDIEAKMDQAEMQEIESTEVTTGKEDDDE